MLICGLNLEQWLRLLAKITNIHADKLFQQLLHKTLYAMSNFSTPPPPIVTHCHKMSDPPLPLVRDVIYRRTQKVSTSLIRFYLQQSPYTKDSRLVGLNA